MSLSLEQDQDQFQGEAQVPPTPGRKVSLQCETHAVEVKCIFVGLKGHSHEIKVWFFGLHGQEKSLNIPSEG